MLGWIKTKIAEALAENNIRNETASVMKAIDKVSKEILYPMG